MTGFKRIREICARILDDISYGATWASRDERLPIWTKSSNSLRRKRLCARGRVYRQLGEHANALADFRRGEAIDPKEWEGAMITLLYEADSHAHLGDAASALDCCPRLPDDHWTPGLDGAPAGNKAEVAAELRRIAADARRKGGSSKA